MHVGLENYCNKKKHYIFFHDDMDGIYTSAIFIKSFIENDTKNFPIKLCPVKTSMRGIKFNSFIKEICLKNINPNIIIIDYQYNDLCNIWIDHHQNKEFTDKTTNELIEIYNKKHIIYSIGEKSATRVLYNYIIKNQSNKLDVINNFIDDINIIDMIDSANYTNVNSVFNSLHPLMILRAYLENMKLYIDNTYCRIVENIVKYDFDIDDLLFSMNIDNSEVLNLKKRALKIEKNIVKNINVGIIYCNSLYEYPRYSEFFVNQDLPYSIRIINHGEESIHCEIGANPWVEFRYDLNIGKFLSDLSYPISGGGHKKVGGAILKIGDLDKFLNQITTYINEGEDISMEKYSVDKEDSVEKKANEIVKQASSENKEITIDDAREQAVKKIDKKETGDVQG
jgi:hypothetical protein